MGSFVRSFVFFIKQKKSRERILKDLEGTGRTKSYKETKTCRLHATAILCRMGQVTILSQAQHNKLLLHIPYHSLTGKEVWTAFDVGRIPKTRFTYSF